MSADEIQVISKSTIKPESSAQIINLTPWDLEVLFLEYTQMGLLFHKPTPPQETVLLSKTGTTSLIQHLKATLEHTLRFFPPLAGRLATTRSADGASTSFSIDCRGGEGVLFVHAAVRGDVNLTVADVLATSSHAHSFFPLTGVSNCDAGCRPMLGVQVTELADGLFIGWSLNHLLVDGSSFWHFVNTWADISRGEIPIGSPIPRPPYLNRDQVNLDITGCKNIYIHNQHLVPPDNNPATIQPPQPVLKDQVFHLSKESIAKLKARANREMPESRGKISSFQAVVSHLWRSIIRSRFDMNSAVGQETTFEVPMGARQRVNPPLPEEYFGNAVFPGIVTLEARKILENTLGWTAWKINRMVASSSDPNKVKEFFLGWIEKPQFLESVGLPRNYFVIINSPRFNVYGNDFGWGKPVAARNGRSDSFDGRITISAGLEEGSFEVEACLLSETLSKLAEDPEFMEFFKSKC